MKLQHYRFKAGHGFTTFEFVSKGSKGQIIKVVQFQQTDIPNLYNLAFGDKNIESGEIDDMSITDNGDSERVLATVVATVYAFTDRHPSRLIYATGSTKARARLYRMGINKYFDIAANDFEIRGEYQNQWEWYQKDKDYAAFAVKRKLIKFE